MANIFKNTAKFLTIIFLMISFAANTAFGDESTKNRFRSCTPEAGATTSSDNPHPEGLDFDPTGGGKDFMYEPFNPFCLAVALPPYVGVKSAIAAMNRACGSGSFIPRLSPSPIQDFVDIAKAGRGAANPTCAASIAGAIASLGGFIATTITIQYFNAKDVYNNTTLCGSFDRQENYKDGSGSGNQNWTRWNSVTMSRDIPSGKKDAETTIDTWIANCNANPNSSECTMLASGNVLQSYREWYYGGVEREDVSDDACPDVTRRYDPNNDKNKVSYKGQDFPAQKYYMRGTEPGNYSCERFNYRFNKNDPLNNNSPLSEPRIQDYEYAHKCCIKKSQSTVCIERKLCKTGGYVDSCPQKSNIAIVHKFCHGGSLCSLGGSNNNSGFVSLIAEYSAAFEDNNRMICVSSYSMCPYNFNIGGGSTECNYFKDGKGEGGSFKAVSPEDIANHTCDGKSEIRNANCDINDKAGKCKNYCQYLNHCVIVAGNDYIYDTNISSPYFSSACLNFVGDSQNKYSYGKSLGKYGTSITGAQKHFTAPIAECIRETLENVFYNHAGHTKCGILGEFPSMEGKCFTDLYVYKKGENIASSRSFFSYIQENLKSAIKMVLTISIMMQGLKILLTGAPLKQTELTMYVVKLGLVLFFATGNAWQGFFFDGVYNASATFSTIVMNVKTSPNPDQRDGCQFGKMSMPDGTSVVVSEYPKGKQYISVFDTFDCKIARYLGFGPSVTVANIAKLILAAFFTGPIGIYFAILTMIFGFYIVVAAFRVLHIFLTSAFAIILLIYVSPITITASLFKKTEGLFNRWLGHLIGYSLQPIILFAYMGLFLTILDTLVIGSATFKGNPPQRIIVCSKICVDQNGSLIPLAKDQVATECKVDIGEKIVDPMSDSVACMMNLGNDKFGKIPVLEPLGIAIPMLKNFFSDNGRQKILTMTKAVLILFILAQFLDEIPGIASNLMGGNNLPAAPAMSGMDLAKKVAGIGLAVQKRAAGAARKSGSSAGSAIKKNAQAAGDKGKKGS
jgi:type IV secretory pathway VirB6-like protein